MVRNNDLDKEGVQVKCTYACIPFQILWESGQHESWLPKLATVRGSTVVSGWHTEMIIKSDQSDENDWSVSAVSIKSSMFQSGS